MSVRDRVDGEKGSVLAWLPLLLVLVVLVAVVLLELGAQLVAIARAASLADAAALAAVATATEHPATSHGPASAHGPAAASGAARVAPAADDAATDPVAAAREVVRAGGGRLESCRCPRGAGRSEVEVSIEVPAVTAAGLGPRRQHATAAAVLAPAVPPATDER